MNYSQCCHYSDGLLQSVSYLLSLVASSAMSLLSLPTFILILSYSLLVLPSHALLSVWPISVALISASQWRETLGLRSLLCLILLLLTCRCPNFLLNSPIPKAYLIALLLVLEISSASLVSLKIWSRNFFAPFLLCFAPYCQWGTVSLNVFWFLPHASVFVCSKISFLKVTFMHYTFVITAVHYHRFAARAASSIKSSTWSIPGLLILIFVAVTFVSSKRKIVAVISKRCTGLMIMASEALAILALFNDSSTVEILLYSAVIFSMSTTEFFTRSTIIEQFTKPQNKIWIRTVAKPFSLYWKFYPTWTFDMISGSQRALCA